MVKYLYYMRIIISISFLLLATVLQAQLGNNGALRR
jgi:hypothetical protein